MLIIWRITAVTVSNLARNSVGPSLFAYVIVLKILPGILVRDDAARRKLRLRVGNIGIIL